MAPVSSIVSRVSSPAEPTMEHVSDSNTTQQQSSILSSSGLFRVTSNILWKLVEFSPSRVQFFSLLLNLGSTPFLTSRHSASKFGDIVERFGDFSKPKSGAASPQLATKSAFFQ